MGINQHTTEEVAQIQGNSKAVHDKIQTAINTTSFPLDFISTGNKDVDTRLSARMVQLMNDGQYSVVKNPELKQVAINTALDMVIREECTRLQMEKANTGWSLKALTAHFVKSRS